MVACGKSTSVGKSTETCGNPWTIRTSSILAKGLRSIRSIARRLSFAIAMFVGLNVSVWPTIDIGSLYARQADSTRQDSALGQSPGVELEVIFDPRQPLRDGAEWAQMLSDVGFDRVRIRKATASDELGVNQISVANRLVWQITAGIHRNELILPGTRVSLQQPGQIKDWLHRFRQQMDGGSRGSREGSIQKPAASSVVAFGLGEQELVELSDRLSVPLPESTWRKPSSQVMQELQKSSPITLVPNRDSALAVANSPSQFPLELRGVAMGTALAAFGRTAGVVLVPGKTDQGTVQLCYQASDGPREFWPVGWPTDVPLGDLAPRCVQWLDWDLRGQTMAEAFQRVAQQSGVPILPDRNTLIPAGLDIDKLTTRLQARGKTPRKVLDLLAQEHRPAMRIELRVDEAGKAFFWVSAY